MAQAEVCKTPTRIQSPISTGVVKSLRTGQRVLLSGAIYTARDAAHKRMIQLLENRECLFFGEEDSDSCIPIYYAGPCPAPPGKIIGSVGPTTSKRMDAYAPRMIKEGFGVMIGKGNRSKEVLDAIREYNGLYLAAIGGAGVIYALCVESAETVAFEDLGAEAVYRLIVRDMPLIVAIDSFGGNLYERSV